MDELRKSGIEVLGEIPWGTHFCSFYQDKEDLLNTLVPYFAAGLANNEYCLWIISDPLTVADATAALRAAVPGLDAHASDGRIEILPHVEWYLRGGKFIAENVISSWKDKLADALENGYAGMRVNGNESWLDRDVWKNFIDYERQLNETLADHHIIVLCTYALAKCDATAILDVAQVHECAITKREGRWQVLEAPEIKLAKAQLRKQNKYLTEQAAERTSRLSAILENTDTAYILLDTTQHILLLNQLAVNYTAHVLGKPAKEGEYFSDHPAAEKKELFEERAGTALNGNQVSYESSYLDPDGSIRHFSVKLFPIFHEHDAAQITGLVFSASEITQRLQLEAQLEAAREQEQLAVTDAVITGEEKARQEMGLELHDNINQVLAAAQLYLDVFIQKNPAPDFLLQKTDTLISEAIKEIRNLSHATISPFIEGDDLSAALDNLSGIIERPGSIKVTRKFTGLEQDDIPEKCKLTIYRVVQEQFHNILKYAKAKNVLLQVGLEGNTITILVQDDGIGCDTSKKANGIGLRNIKTRISLFHGEMELVSSPGNGCSLRVRMQLAY